MNTESKDRILLVDDNATNLQVLYKTLSPLNAELLIAKNGESAVATAEKAKPDVILLDIMMPGMNGYEVCQKIKSNPKTEKSAIIFLSALGEVKDKVKGLELGGVDYITKPFQAEEVIARVKTQLKICHLQRQLENELNIAQELLQQIKSRIDGPLLGNSEIVQNLKKSISLIAVDEHHVLLQGVSGCGEEVIARSIHEQSPRRKKPFIYINCALINEQRIEEMREKFYLGNGGTVYLNKIDVLPPNSQKNLQQILLEMQNNQERKAHIPDVRVICFSVADLIEKVLHNKFLGSLLDIIAQKKLLIPTLVERREDIAPLAKYYIKQYAAQLGKNIESISDESIEKMMLYNWPGNIRELQNFIERQVVLGQGNILNIDEKSLRQGTSVGSYNLMKKLGVGGMGEVWLAKHHLLARPAAVKLIKLDTDDLEDKHVCLQRFQVEAESTAKLRSPNTIEIYDYGIVDDSFYYVMEYLEGLDLDDMVECFGALQPERTVMILKQVCRSLIEAHQLGLIHRDIKPQNLFVCKLGAEYDVLKVLDFGIVKSSKQETQLTEVGTVIGTPTTIAPELIPGREFREASPSSDLYSLGCVGYWLLTRKQVFETSNVMEMLFSHMEKQPLPPSIASPFDVPKELDSLILKCLEKKPENRPASARELWEQLDQIEFKSPWTQSSAEKWWKLHNPQVIEQDFFSSSSDNKTTKRKT